ncbi:MAG TPA: hypothetical protein VFZ66_20280 [Herpetosiphonaceae bacterium]
MNRTIAGRLALIRGARHQLKTFAKQAEDVRGWWPIAVPALLVVFVRSYQGELKKMHEERMREIKQEKQMFEKVERQLVREIGEKSGAPGRLRRLLPGRTRRA